MPSYLPPIQNFFDTAVEVFMAIFLAYFFWGLVHYIVEGGDEAARLHAKRQLLAGATWLVFLMALWWLLGLVNFTGTQFPL